MSEPLIAVSTMRARRRGLASVFSSPASIAASRIASLRRRVARACFTRWATPDALSRNLAYLQIDPIARRPPFAAHLVKHARATRRQIEALLEAAIEAGELKTDASPRRLARMVETGDQRLADDLGAPSGRAGRPLAAERPRSSVTAPSTPTAVLKCADARRAASLRALATRPPRDPRDKSQTTPRHPFTRPGSPPLLQVALSGGALAAG